MKTRLQHLAMLAAIVGLPASYASARQLSPSEALARLSSSGPQKKRASNVNATPVYTVKDSKNKNFTGLYIFNDKSAGYVIVSADDQAVPLLAYSDSGSFNPDNVPPQLSWWLQFYTAEMAGATSQKPRLTSGAIARPERASISPLTVSKWDQGAPYNDDCPLDKGKRSVTGCVATAMAQEMYFHQWPAKGSGEHSYKWNDTTLSVNFAETTYDWSQMTPTYDDKSTAEAKAAVANLMYSCGVSVDMSYSSDESGASSLSIGPALLDYFGYDASMSQPQRYYYGLIDWENIIYDQLQQGLPVLYGGQSYEGGHQFICDGYSSDGYFHFNWGWSGMSDGYYLLSALDPMDQGIGGSASQSGFDFDQGILINAKPAQAGSQVPVLIYCYGNLSSSTKDEIDLGKDVNVTAGDGFLNFAAGKISGYFGLKLVNEQRDSIFIENSRLYILDPVNGYRDYEVKLPETLSDGVYTATPVFKRENATDYTAILTPLSGNQYLSIQVSDGKAKVSAGADSKLEVTNFTLNTPLYLGKDFSATITFTNPGTEEYFGEFNLFLFDSDGYEVAPSADLSSIDIMPGETITMTYVSSFPTEVTSDSQTLEVQPGQYILAMITHFTNEVVYEYEDYVSVQAAPESTQLSVDSFGLADGSDTATSDKVKFTGSVTCDEGYFAGQLRVAVFRKNATSTDMSAKSDFLFLSEGSTSDFSATVDVSMRDKDEAEFFAVVYQTDEEEISNPYYFTIKESAGVKDVSSEVMDIEYVDGYISITADSNISAWDLYGFDGIRYQGQSAVGDSSLSINVADLPHGNYIVVVSSEDGTVSHYHFLK